MGAVLDLRIFTNGNTVTVFRVDDQGIQVSTPGHLKFYASGDITFAGGSNLNIDVENCVIQERAVQKTLGASY